MLLCAGQWTRTVITVTVNSSYILCAEYLYCLWVSTGPFYQRYVVWTFYKPCFHFVVVTSLYVIHAIIVYMRFPGRTHDGLALNCSCMPIFPVSNCSTYTEKTWNSCNTVNLKKSVLCI